MKKLIIFGMDDFAELVKYYFEHDSEYSIVGFTVDREYMEKTEFCGLPVIPFEEIEATYPPEEYEVFVAIAYTNLNLIREKKYNEVKAKGYKLATYISSRVLVWDTLEIGDNCFIFELNNIQPYVTIGNNVILWSGNHIGHHGRIDDNVFITSHVVVSGRCHIGNNSFIGVNATINDHIHVAPLFSGGFPTKTQSNMKITT